MNHPDREDENTTQTPVEATPEPDNRDLLIETFVGPNAAYFLLAWDVMRERRWSWNWSAFFFGEGWLLYRKMYLLAILFSLARMALTPYLSSITLFSDSLLNQAIPLLFPYTMVLNIVLGIYANHLYRIHAEKKIREAIAEFKPERRLLGVQTRGGVSLLALLWIPVIAIVEHMVLLLVANDFSFQWTEITQSL
jgi:hypothetical protein